MHSTTRYIASIVSAILLFGILRLMLPSSSDPEDVVRSYVGHWRTLQTTENYELLSSDVHSQLSERNISDKYDYFDLRLGEFPQLREYKFISFREEDEVCTIEAEVRFARDAFPGFVYGAELADAGPPPIDTLAFILLKQNGDWVIDELHVDEVAWLP